MFALPTKITTEITVMIQEAAAGQIPLKIVGFSMGNAWIAPEEQAMSYGPLLYQLVIAIRYTQTTHGNV